MQNKNTQAHREIDSYRKYLSYKIHEVIRRKIKRNWKFGRIFKHMRRMKEFISLSSLGLFRTILLELVRMNKMPSREIIKYHFRNKVSRDDYSKSNKKEVLEDLYSPTT